MSRFPFPTTPDGWYGVAFAPRLASGAVKAIHYFGRDLALFRDEGGRARVFDAHCPHMGAHLGHGGLVSGEGIRCPFHGWRFDGEGRCVEVPHLGRVQTQTLRVTAGGSDAVEVLARTTNSGPGISATRVHFGEIETLTPITHTPADDEAVELQLNFCMRKLENPAAAAAIEKRNRDIVIEQFRQDIPIWENKVYRE